MSGLSTRIQQLGDNRGDRRHHWLGALLLTLAACAAPATTSAPLATSTPSESVVCDFFPANGLDPTAEAAIAAIQAAGGQNGENPAAAARKAIASLEALAARASGEEQEDLLALANTMNDAELSGEGYVGWSDASNAFYVKYAEQCGLELAS